MIKINDIIIKLDLFSGIILVFYGRVRNCLNCLFWGVFLLKFNFSWQIIPVIASVFPQNS